jgi:hypothetical protein
MKTITITSQNKSNKKEKEINLQKNLAKKEEIGNIKFSWPERLS